MEITTAAIQLNGQIAPQYTCDGANISPLVIFSQIPNNAKSTVLILEDPDAPGGTFIHWLLYDMSPATLVVPENEMPTTGKVGTNDFGQLGYGGPCPPSGTHRYIFRLLALDARFDLPEGISKRELNEAMKGHVIDLVEIVGTYAKTSR